MRTLSTTLALLLSLFLVGCGVGAAPAEPVEGRILLWHAWPEADSAALDALLEMFMDIYPRVHVVRSALPAEEIVAQYAERARMGLGPDLLLAPAACIAALADEGLIRPLDPLAPETDPYYPPALETVRYGGALYGLPLTLHTTALFYHRAHAAGAPATLDALLAEASAGRPVALTTDAYHAYWGIRAFGGRALDDEGRVVVDQGGFANWLGWLKIAQSAPGVILAPEHGVATALFLEGHAAYYVGAADELPALREALGADQVGVAPLPAGPYGAAGPLLDTQAMLVSAASNEADLALRLAASLSTPEQQERLARRTGRIPANRHVRVDPRLLPDVATLLGQTRTAVPRRNLPQMATLLAEGDRTYALVLEGVQTVAEAAGALAAAVNAAHGLEGAPGSIAADCALEGILRIWHGWEGDDEAALRQVVQAFSAACPGVYAGLRRAPADLTPAAYREAVETHGAPDVLIGPADWIAPLAGEGLLRDLTHVAAPLAERFRPRANRAVGVGGATYALPLAVGLTGLYYDREHVEAPPETLDALLAEAAGQRGAALAAGAREAFWLLPATGGVDLGPDGYPRIDAAAVAAWVSFLARAAESPHVVLAPDAAAARGALVAGDAAYLAGGPSALRPLQATLGAERVGVAPLPAGPAGPARPLLTVEGLMLPVPAQARDDSLALAFADYATDVAAQTLLVERAGRIPGNVNVSLEAHPAVSALAAQEPQALVLPCYPAGASPWEAGDALLEAALATGDGVASGEDDVAPLVERFVALLNGEPATAEAHASPEAHAPADTGRWE